MVEQSRGKKKKKSEGLPRAHRDEIGADFHVFRCLNACLCREVALKHQSRALISLFLKISDGIEVHLEGAPPHQGWAGRWYRSQGLKQLQDRCLIAAPMASQQL